MKCGALRLHAPGSVLKILDRAREVERGNTGEGEGEGWEPRMQSSCAWCHREGSRGEVDGVCEDCSLSRFVQPAYGVRFAPLHLHTNLMKKPADHVFAQGLGVAQGLHPHQGAGRHLRVSMSMAVGKREKGRMQAQCMANNSIWKGGKT